MGVRGGTSTHLGAVFLLVLPMCPGQRREESWRNESGQEAKNQDDVGGPGLALSLNELDAQVTHLGTTDLASLSLSFLVCKMRV